MSSMHVIGIGSPFVEDNIAEHVIKKLLYLQSSSPQLKDVGIEYYDRPHLQIIDLIKGAKRVVFIDAFVSDDEDVSVAQVCCFTAIEILNKHKLYGSTNLHSSHAIGLAFCLQLAESLGELPQDVTVLGIKIPVNELQLHPRDEFDLVISDHYANAINEAVMMAVKLLETS